MSQSTRDAAASASNDSRTDRSTSESSPMKRLFQLVSVALLLCGSVCSQARMYSDYLDRDVKRPPDDISTHNKVGDPVYVSNGELSIRKVDLTIPSVGFAFSFVRTYLSRTKYDGPLGRQWDHSFNQRLEAVSSTELDSYEGNNQVYKYTWDTSDSTYDAPTGKYDHIVSDSGNYVRETEHGFQYRYEQVGSTSWYRLKSMKDRNGNQMDFLYDATDDTGKLTEVKDTNVRSYTFLYEASGLLTEVKDFGTSARSIVYEYDADDQLTSVTELDGESGLERETTYDCDFIDNTGTDDDRSLVVTITDPKQNAISGVPFVRNYYDSSDRVIAQEYGTGADSEEDPPPSSSPAFLWSYGTQTNGDPRTTFTERGGRKIKFDFDTNGLMTKRTFMNGAVDGPVETFEYDGRYNLLTHTKPNGDEIRYSYPDPAGSPTPGKSSLGNVLSVESVDDSGSGSLEWKYTYTLSYNQVKTVEDPSGMFRKYTYDAKGNLLTTTTDADGTAPLVTAVFHYDSTNNYVMDWSEDGLGNRTAYDYDTDHYLIKVRRDSTGSNIAVAEYDHDEFGNVKWIKDGLGNKTDFTVNRLNQVTQITAPSPLGYETTFTYDLNGNVITTVIDNGSEDYVAVIEYDLLDHMTKRTEDIDATTTRSAEYFYDEDEILTKVKDPEGNETVYEFDQYNLQTKVKLGFGSSEEVTYTYEYDENFRLTKTIRPEDATQTTTLAYDHHNRVTKTTDAEDTYVQRTFTDHLLTKVEIIEDGQSSNPDSKVEYEYDPYDRLTKTRAMAKVSRTGSNIGDGYLDTTIVYDLASNVVTMKDDSGSAQAAYTYDALQRLSTSEDAIGNKVTFTYDNASNVITLKEQEKEEGVSGFDTYETLFAYDSLNRRTETTDSGSKVWKYTYDARNLVTTEDPNGHKSYSTYDRVGRLIELARDVSGSSQITVEWAYDKAGGLTTVTDAVGNETDFEYDALGRMTKKVFADTFDIDWEYDENSNVTKRTDQNATAVTYLYDNLDRLTKKTFSITASHINGEKTAEEYTYDVLGRLITAMNTTSRVIYAYNTLGLVESEEMQYGTDNKSAGTGMDVEWDYDAQGLVTALRYPGADATDGELRYGYDSGNRVTEVTRQVGGTAKAVAAWTFKGGRVIKKVFGNATVGNPGVPLLYCDVTYTSRRKVETLEHYRAVDGAADEAIATFEYEYDDAGVVTSEGIIHYKNDGTTLEESGFVYAYDKANRLTEVYRGVDETDFGSTAPTNYDFEFDYEFDDAGNRQTVTRTPNGGSAVEHVYTTNSTNAYTAIDWGGTTETYLYDKAGNRTSVQNVLRTWEYNYQNRLVKVKESATEIAAYWYDALGRRWGKTYNVGAGGVVKRFIYAGSSLIQEYDITEDAQENEVEELEFDYVWGGGPAQIRRFTLDGVEDATPPLDIAAFYHGNQYGSTYALSEDSATADILENYRYFEYGAATIYADDTTTAGTPFGNNLLWHGRYYDTEVTEVASGMALYKGKPRGYDPETGAHISRSRDQVSVGAAPGSQGLSSPREAGESHAESGFGVSPELGGAPRGRPSDDRNGDALRFPGGGTPFYSGPIADGGVTPDSGPIPGDPQRPGGVPEGGGTTRGHRPGLPDRPGTKSESSEGLGRKAEPGPDPSDPPKTGPQEPEPGTGSGGRTVCGTDPTCGGAEADRLPWWENQWTDKGKNPLRAGKYWVINGAIKTLANLTHDELIYILQHELMVGLEDLLLSGSFTAADLNAVIDPLRDLLVKYFESGAYIDINFNAHLLTPYIGAIATGGVLINRDGAYVYASAGVGISSNPWGEVTISFNTRLGMDYPKHELGFEPGSVNHQVQAGWGIVVATAENLSAYARDGAPYHPVTTGEVGYSTGGSASWTIFAITNRPFYRF